MATFTELLDGLKTPKQASAHRVKLMQRIAELTDHPTILYAANTRGSHAPPEVSLSPDDKTGFAELLADIPGDAVNVVLHSYGGSVEAAEAIVGLLRPQLKSVDFIIASAAKSAATLLALSGNALYMDERAELGPIDPQIWVPQPGGHVMLVPAQAIVSGFERARGAVMKDQKELLAYGPLLQKCDLYLLEMCRSATELARERAMQWLSSYMFKEDEDAEEKAKSIADYLAHHEHHKSHARPIGLREATNIGLKVKDTRKNPKLREAVWELYCNLEIWFERMPQQTKLFENAEGISFFRTRALQRVAVQQQAPTAPPQPSPKPKPKKGKKQKR